MRIATLDIGGTSIKAGLFNDGIIMDFKEFPTCAKNGADYILNKASDILKSFYPFDRIGVSTAGQVNVSTGEIIFANKNIPNYTGKNIKSYFENIFSVTVCVENDVNCAAIGELVCGTAKDINNAICITYGTGVGGAIIIGGEIYNGMNYSAAEFGHIVTHANGLKCACGQAGCYEQYASVSALLKKSSMIFPLADGHKFMDLVNEGNNIAIEILNEWIMEITYGLSSLTHIFNPNLIIIGGGIMEQSFIISLINEKFKSSVMPSYANTLIKAAKLGNKAGIYGAYFMALSKKQD